MKVCKSLDPGAGDRKNAPDLDGIRLSRSGSPAIPRKELAGWTIYPPRIVTAFSKRGRGRPRYIKRLHQALIQHRIGHFQEAGDVGAVHEVAGRAVFLGRFVAVAVDGDHDLVQSV